MLLDAEAGIIDVRRRLSAHQLLLYVVLRTSATQFIEPNLAICFVVAIPVNLNVKMQSLMSVPLANLTGTNVRGELNWGQPGKSKAVRRSSKQREDSGFRQEAVPVLEVAAGWTPVLPRSGSVHV